MGLVYVPTCLPYKNNQSCWYIYHTSMEIPELPGGHCCWEGAISHTNGFMCQSYNLDNLGGYIVTSIILWEIYDVFR